MFFGKRGKSVCYFLACSQNVEFVSFLLSSLYRSKDLFVVHCDKKSPDILKVALRHIADRFPNVVLLESSDYSWAGFSQVKTTLNAIQVALSADDKWSHFICLSEQHLPLLSPQEIAEALPVNRSMIPMRSGADATGRERNDLLTRFLVNYEELPGCGCFATSLASVGDDVLRDKYHGTNWFILARSHARQLLTAEQENSFKLFRRSVHADETAIQSVLRLRAAASDLENKHSVLIAQPHLTDNSSLIMTDELFWKAKAEGFLFIRKRQQTLSNEVASSIKKSGFNSKLYETGLSAKTASTNDTKDEHANSLFEKLRTDSTLVEWRQLDPAKLNNVPRFHAAADLPGTNGKRTVRIVSENMKDFRVSLVDISRPFNGFLIPFEANGALFSTLRIRLHDFAYHTDILPLADKRRGRLALTDSSKTSDLIEMASSYIEFGTRLEAPSLLNADASM